MVIQEYDNSWPEKFIKIKKVLENGLTCIYRIEHVGSTSIVGMCAKPIIDIDIIIDGISTFKIAKRELEGIGYAYDGNLGIPGREVFSRSGRKYDKYLDTITHHLYVCECKNEELKRHIHFRNILRTNEEARNEYCRIKYEILEKVGSNNREGYVEMKENEYKQFFDKILAMKE